MHLPDHIVNLIEAYRQPLFPPSHEEAKIRVDSIASKLAFAYEKVRNVMEYREEHLMLRYAVERNLRRRLSGDSERFDEVAKSLIEELIRARYVPNGILPESKIHHIGMIVEKYVHLLRAATAGKDEKERKQLFDWIMGIASADVEEHLISHRRERALVKAMYQSLVNHIVFLETELTQQERDIFLFIAMNRCLVKHDLAVIRYYLLKNTVPEWGNATPELVTHVAADIRRLKKTIEEQVTHPTVKALERILKPWITVLVVLRDLIQGHSEHADQLLVQPSVVAVEVAQVCDEKYAFAKKLLRRRAIRSVIYLFFTKILLAFAIELPYDIYVIGNLALAPLFVNVVFHPLLLTTIAVSTKVPSASNTQKIIDGVRAICAGVLPEKLIFKIPKTRKGFSVSSFFMGVLYAVTYLVSFGCILWVLYTLSFNFVSMSLFLLFLSLVSFFGIRLRSVARELVVTSRKENVFSFLFDLFTVPIVRAGQWLSDHSSKINVFVFIMDFIIEAPFKFFVEIFEKLIYLIREKREELY